MCSGPSIIPVSYTHLEGYKRQGFYYVDVEESGIYECKAKGIFRKEGQKPLVGDLVEIEILDEAEKTGNMTRILPRKNELIRPAVANIDQALVIFALENPTPNLTLLDRFLVMMEQQNVPTAICFNKRDLAGEDCARRGPGYFGWQPVVFVRGVGPG